MSRTTNVRELEESKKQPALQRSAPASSSITVNFLSPGVYPYEVDYAKGGDKNLTLTMLAGGAPIPPSVLLTLSPSQGTPLQEKQIEELNVSALATDGVAVGNLPVAVTVTGVNQQTRSLVTDGTGNVQFAYAGDPFNEWAKKGPLPKPEYRRYT